MKGKAFFKNGCIDMYVWEGSSPSRGKGNNRYFRSVTLQGEVDVCVCVCVCQNSKRVIDLDV